jgi:hypothetical protein
MRQDRLSTSRERSIVASYEGGLLNALYQFAQSRRFAAAASDAFAVYWAGVFDLDGLRDVDADDVRRTMEWFVHDVHVGEERRHVIDLFVEAQKERLPAPALAFLEAWSQGVMGLFRVVAPGQGAELELYDPLRQIECQAEDAVLARNAQRSDVIIARAFTWQGTRRLSALSLLLPAPYETPLVQYAQNAFRLYGDEHPGTTWDVCLRENGHLFNVFLLSERANSLRALVGPGTRYHDPAITRDRLRAHTQQRRQEARQEQGEQASQTPWAPVRRTNSGIILPGAPEPPTRGPQSEPEAKPRILIPGRDR